MSITHVFFDVHDVLVDRVRLGRCYDLRLGQILTTRYGGTAAAWAEANRRVIADWDSYYTDLNLGGSDGIADMWEGIFRTTRALFRLAEVPEPAHEELIALSRELPGLATEGCDALYPEVPEVLAELDGAGLLLGAISQAPTNQLRAALAPVLRHFKLPIWGADASERFEKDIERYRFAAAHAGAAPRNCLVLDDKISPLLNATAAGMHAIQIRRASPYPPRLIEHVLPDLRGLVAYCLEQGERP